MLEVSCRWLNKRIKVDLSRYVRNIVSGSNPLLSKHKKRFMSIIYSYHTFLLDVYYLI